MLKCTIEWVCKHKTYEGYCMAPFTCSAAFEDSEHGPDSPEGVSGASDCSDPRSGADNRAALAAKRPIPPRVAGRNPKVRGGAQSSDVAKQEEQDHA